MNQTIIQFLQQQTCATICCVDEDDKPYCFSCFYAFNSENGLLYFKSSANSHHSTVMNINPVIAGTILPDKLNKVTVKGVQFEGIVLDAHHTLIKQASGNYFKKYPLSLAIPGEIWTIQINHIKMTDSTIGFRKKIAWTRMEQVEQKLYNH
jgi:uncharacterized protein YhbP (UPF0306 family)